MCVCCKSVWGTIFQGWGKGRATQREWGMNEGAHCKCILTGHIKSEVAPICIYRRGSRGSS